MRSKSSGQKKALIFGITGQDGSYLAEFLLSQGYEVHGVVRRSSTFNTSRLDHLYKDPLHNKDIRLFLHYGDVTDYLRVSTLVSEVQPTEIYNLAAQSHVRVSFDEPIYTGSTAGLGATAILESVLRHKPDAKYYQAASSEMFGASPPPQNELTDFYPRSPYGVAKVYAYWITKNYREAHGIYAVNGILFNHESPRRGQTFVTRKISLAAARIKLGLQSRLVLGNLESVRDWGYAPEYVIGMWKMLQCEKPSDFVLATGTHMSVAEFAKKAFSVVDLDSEEYIDFDPRYLRPTEVDSLIGDYSRAARELNWAPRIFGESLVELMVSEDLKFATNLGGSHVDKPIFHV
jgi:GDPmannose 4,6-dehydratase